MLGVIGAMRDGGARAVPPEAVPSAPEPEAPEPERAAQEADAQARDFLLNGMSREKLERTILRSFLFADTSNTGVLDENEFAACIRDIGLGLTPAQIAELMAAVDKNDDGVIAYDEWVPLAFELMVHIVKQNMVEAASPAADAAGSWSTIAKSYQQPGATDSPVMRPTVGSGPSTELEGRVHALQSRRLLRGWVKDLFALLDTDMDGRLSEAELAAQTGVELAKQMINVMDTNRDGKLSQVEVRDYFDQEAAKAFEEQGVPEWEFLQGIVETLGITA